MFGSYLQGFIGIIIVIGGLLAMLAGVFDSTYFFVGLLMVFGGGYMRYLSSQTTRIGDDLTSVNIRNPNTQFSIDDNDEFDGVKDLSSDDYRLFLVEKYNISKNEVLQKFSIDRKSFNTLDDAINAADVRERSVSEVEVATSDVTVAERTYVDGELVGKKGKVYRCGFYNDGTVEVFLNFGSKTFDNKEEAEVFLKK
jgi:hypothetical protein